MWVTVFHNCLFIHLLLRHGIIVIISIVINPSVYVSVCLSVCLREHVSGAAGPIFTKFCAQIPCGRDSVLLWRRCDTLCTSGFMDDVTLGRNGPHGYSWRLHIAATCVRRGATGAESDVYECLGVLCGYLKLDIKSCWRQLGLFIHMTWKLSTLSFLPVDGPCKCASPQTSSAVVAAFLWFQRRLQMFWLIPYLPPCLLVCC